VEKKNYPAPQSGTWLWMAVDQGRLYGQALVAAKAAGEASTSVLCALDLKSGEAVWTYESKTPLCLWFTCLGGGAVYACALEEKGKGFLLAVDAASGKERWRTPIAFKNASGAFSPDQRVFTTAGYYRGKYYVWTTGKGTSAYDAKTGELAQEFPAMFSGGPGGGGDMTAPLFVGDKMYFTAGNAYKCVDLATGNEIKNGNGMAKAGCGPGSASMTNLYSGGQGFSVVDLASGQKWNGSIPCRSPCIEGPRPANGLLYVMPSHCGCPYLMTGPIALAPAGENWSPLDADKDLPARVCAGPAADSALNADGDGKVEGAQIAPNVPKNSAPTAPAFGGGMSFVGSRTGIIYGADGATGELRWTFCCGGAIRRPPAYARGRLLVGSDDGWVYGLEAKTGRLAWRFRAAPEERYFNLQGELTSAWPVRTGIVVDNETAYCGAGLFPFDGAYLYALDVKSGKPAWTRRIGDQDHPDAIPQAELTLSGDKLQLSPAPSLGRKSLPVFYRKSDGERVK
jgi:outer membrane protein assembly factor BamB